MTDNRGISTNYPRLSESVGDSHTPRGAVSTVMKTPNSFSVKDMTGNSEISTDYSRLSESVGDSNTPRGAASTVMKAPNTLSGEHEYHQQNLDPDHGVPDNGQLKLHCPKRFRSSYSLSRFLTIDPPNEPLRYLVNIGEGWCQVGGDMLQKKMIEESLMEEGTENSNTEEMESSVEEGANTPSTRSSSCSEYFA